MDYPQRLKAFLFSVVIIAIIVLYQFTDIREWLSVESLRSTIQGAGIFGELWFILSVAIGVSLFVPMTPFCLVAGYCFSGIKGSLLVIIGGTLGASLLWIISRYFLHQSVSNWLSKRPNRFSRFIMNANSVTLTKVIICRFIPVPFSMMTLVLSLTSVTLTRFIVGTALGSAAPIYVFTNLAGAADNVKQPQFVIAILLYICLIIATMFIKKNVRND